MEFYWLMRYFVTFLTINLLYVQGFIGEPCRYDEDCAHVEHSYCEMQQVCQCKHNFIATENGDTCIAMVGAYCHSKYDCSSLPNSVCKDYSCQCDKEFIADPQGARCLPVATHIEDNCHFRNQCIPIYGEFSDCVRNQCTCIHNYHFAGRCLYNKGLNQPCANSSECYIGDAFKETVVCSNHYCTCKAGYHENEYKLCISGSPIKKTYNGLMIVFISILLYPWGT